MAVSALFRRNGDRNMKLMSM